MAEEGNFRPSVAPKSSRFAVCTVLGSLYNCKDVWGKGPLNKTWTETEMTGYLSELRVCRTHTHSYDSPRSVCQNDNGVSQMMFAHVRDSPPGKLNCLCEKCL